MPSSSSVVSVIFCIRSRTSDSMLVFVAVYLGVLLASICYVLLVVSDGVHDNNMWRLMLTVDLLKHGIPYPSSLIPAHSLSSNLGPEKENKDKVHESEEYMVAPVFVHTK
ncbi:hypothetical protein CFP56_007358 [Quercus suber]|uniref:Transmembrane protein n=1 Tax=Quercus suber TaxID=58331 RepID=A0AAW0L5C8_QUESU